MNIKRGVIVQGSAVTLLDRIQDDTGNYPAPSDISEITASVVDLDTDLTTGSVTTTGTDAIQSSLQKGNGWVKDTIGWNSKIDLDGSLFPEGNRTYQVEITYTPTSGNTFTVVWHLYAERTYTNTGS